MKDMSYIHTGHVLEFIHRWQNTRISILEVEDHQQGKSVIVQQRSRAGWVSCDITNKKNINEFHLSQPTVISRNPSDDEYI